MSNKYKGWSNYQTFRVAQWLVCDDACLWMSAAKEEFDGVLETPHVKEGLWTQWEGATRTLGERIRQHAHAQKNQASSPWDENLGEISLDDVNWREIAAAFLQEYSPRRVESPAAFLVRTAECRFSLGKVVATPGALNSLAEHDILTAINRHVRGDWGVVDEEDARSNDESIDQDLRLLSAYKSSAGERFWIITEADRSVTTVLLPQEY